MQIIICKEAKAQGLKRYFTGKPCKYGHIAERYCSDSYCVACNAARVKAHRRANREENLARQKAWYAANRDKHLARQKACYAADRERVLARLKAYKKANRKELSAREKAYRANSPQAKAALNLSTRIRHALQAASATKSARTLELLGASIEEVRAHLEAQFKLGMTWSNWSPEGWHVDHIKPCASFDLTDPEQQKACFHYSNLQPLWAKDNLSKNDRLDWLPAEVN